MHDARRFQQSSSVRRLVVGAVTSVLLAAALTVIAPVVGNALICAAYTPNDVEWYLFFCYLDPSPKDPKA